MTVDCLAILVTLGAILILAKGGNVFSNDIGSLPRPSHGLSSFFPGQIENLRPAQLTDENKGSIRAQMSSGIASNASLQGYFYTEFYSDTTCSSTPIFSYGYSLGECMINYDSSGMTSGSVVFACDGSTLFYYIFASASCDQEYFEYNITLGDSSCYELFVSDEEYGSSFSGFCSNSTIIPVDFNSVMIKGHTNDSSVSCSNDTSMYLAYGLNYCFENKDVSSFQVDCASEEAVSFTQKYYPDNGQCKTNPLVSMVDTGCMSAFSPQYDMINTVMSVSSFRNRKLSNIDLSTAAEHGFLNTWSYDNWYCGQQPTKIVGTKCGTCTKLSSSTSSICTGSKDWSYVNQIVYKNPNCSGDGVQVRLPINYCSPVTYNSSNIYTFTTGVEPPVFHGYSLETSYSDSSCGGDVVQYTAVPLETCLPLSNGKSKMMTCNLDNQVETVMYSDSFCSAVTSSAVASPYCQNLDTTYSAPYSIFVCDNRTFENNTILYDSIEVSCFLPTTFAPTFSPTPIPTMAPTQSHQAQMIVVQNILGVSQSDYLESPGDYNYAMKLTVSQAIGQNVTASMVIIYFVGSSQYDPIGPYNFRSRLLSSTNNLYWGYQITTNQEGVTYDTLSTALSNNVASGAFTANLNINAMNNGATGLEGAVALSSGLRMSDSSMWWYDDDYTDNMLSIGAIIGIGIAVLVFLIAVGVSIYYFCVVKKRRPLAEKAEKQLKVDNANPMNSNDSNL